MSLLVKLASMHDIPSFQTVMARSVIQLIIAFIYMFINRINPITGIPLTSVENNVIPEIEESLLPEPSPQEEPEDEQKQESKLYIAVCSLISNPKQFLALRALSGSFGLASFYYAISTLPLSDATVLFFVGPPITSILAFFLLGETLSILDILAVLASFIGVVLVARPPFLFSDLAAFEESNHAAGVTAGLMGAVFSAVAYTSVRKVTTLKPGLHAMIHVLFVIFLTCVAGSDLCLQVLRRF
jgi:drug/metabolite transporter (DMT)-like permease